MSDSKSCLGLRQVVDAVKEMVLELGLTGAKQPGVVAVEGNIERIVRVVTLHSNLELLAGTVTG